VYKFSWPAAKVRAGFQCHPDAVATAQAAGVALASADLTLFEAAVLGSLPPHAPKDHIWFLDANTAFFGRTSVNGDLRVVVGLRAGASGKLVLDAGLLELRGAFRRQGFGKLLAKRLLSIALPLGIESIEADANMEDGSYVWARLCGRPKNRQGVEAELRKRINLLSAQGLWNAAEEYMALNLIS